MNKNNEELNVIEFEKNIEKIGCCPICGGDINIFIGTKTVSCFCKTCGFFSAVENKNINLESLDE